MEHALLFHTGSQVGDDEEQDDRDQGRAQGPDLDGVAALPCNRPSYNCVGCLVSGVRENQTMHARTHAVRAHTEVAFCTLLLA